MDAISEARLTLICPILAIKVRQMSVILSDKLPFRITQGLRSWNDQEKLYAQGRTTPGAIVTKAKGGDSWHNYGMAVDAVPDDLNIPGFQPDWNEEHPIWKRMIEVGLHVGLASGSQWRTFKDWPHFELTGRFGTKPSDEVKYIFKEGGMEAVWKAAGFGYGYG